MEKSFEDKNNNGVWDEKEFFIDREEKIKPGCHLLTEITGKKLIKFHVRIKT